MGRPHDPHLTGPSAAMRKVSDGGNGAYQMYKGIHVPAVQHGSEKGLYSEQQTAIIWPGLIQDSTQRLIGLHDRCHLRAVASGIVIPA